LDPLHRGRQRQPLLTTRSDYPRKFQQARGRLAIQDRQPRHASEYKLEGTPLAIRGTVYATGGTRRSVVALDGGTGEIRWVYSLREGNRAVAAPRQLSGRGLSYWTDGREERILYVTTGYRLVSLDAKTGQPTPGFGKNGILDLKEGVVYGNRQPIDLETGEIGLHSTPTVTKDTVIVGSSFREGSR